MLNFRYHVVSLVAVFLALGVGVIMGSTVIDSATIDVLEAQQRQLEQQRDSAQHRVGELEDELAQHLAEAELLGTEGSEVLLDRRLEAVPVVVVAPAGIDQDSFSELGDLLAGADADLLGTVRLNERLALGREGERRDLAELLGRSGGSLSALRAAALEVVVAALAGDPRTEEVAPGTGTPADDEPPSPGEGPTGGDPALRVLADAGFVDLEPAEGSSDEVLAQPSTGTYVLVLWSSDAKLSVEALGLPLVRALADRPSLPTVVAEPSATRGGGDGADGEPPVTSLVTTVRADEKLAAALSTVDNVETFPGRLAAVLAFEAEQQGVPGHFGTGSGAQRLLPPPTDPTEGP